MLSEIIKKIEELGGIREYYLHRNWHNGKLELNIEFNNDIANDILNNADIKEIDSCAFWE